MEAYDIFQLMLTCVLGGLAGYQFKGAYLAHKRYRAAKKQFEQLHQGYLKALAKWNAQRVQNWPGVAQVLIPEGMPDKDREQVLEWVKEAVSEHRP